MKSLNKFSLLLLAASFAFTACERDYDAPPLAEPEYTGPAANTTIAELREECAAATEDAPVIITQEQVLKAIVTANDESGNIFKKIYLQDETGAIEMEVDQNSVYNYYPVGQTVYVDLNRLSISVYGDEQQLGHPDGYLYRTPWEDFQAHVQKDGWAQPENVTPIVIDDISTVNTDVDQYKFRLVQFTNVSFENGGKNPFAPEDAYGEENIVDSHGNTLMVRTSSYANFASDILPEGRGNVTGILGRFRGTWQLTLRSADDVAAFTGESTNEGTDTPVKTETIFEESFATGSGSFTIDDKNLPSELTYVWNNDDGYSCMKASAFINNTNYAAESWLVSPEIDLTSATTATLSFEHAINFNNEGAMGDNQIVAVSTDNGNSWTTLSGVSYPESNSWTFVPSGNVDLSAYAGQKIKIAFQYKSSSSSASTWEVKNVKITASTGGSDTPQGGGTAIEPEPV